MSLLEIDELRAGYGNHLVLKGVNLEVNEGEIVCVIGPNGAGKSTLFNSIYGFVDPTDGDVRFGGRSIVGRSQRELLEDGMAYVLQRDSTFPDMTVRENLKMGAFIADDDFDFEAKVDELRSVFPVIEEFYDQKAGTLSGGQQQMVELARGLMLNPEFLLLDEPTAGLAPKIIDQVFERIEAINDRGVTILMIEQNIKTGVDYSDHVFVLDDGETRFDGPAETILDRPEIRDAYLG